MILPRDVRQSMLRKEWDVTQNQIAAAVRANIKAKNQRRATINNLGKATKMEELLESAQRKVKRGLFFQKPVSQQVEQLQEQMSMIAVARAQEELDEMMQGEYSLDEEEEGGEDVDATEDCESDSPPAAAASSSSAAASNVSRAAAAATSAAAPTPRQAIKIEEESDEEEGEGDPRNQGNPNEAKTMERSDDNVVVSKPPPTTENTMTKPRGSECSPTGSVSTEDTSGALDQDEPLLSQLPPAVAAKVSVPPPIREEAPLVEVIEIGGSELLEF